VRRAFAAAVAIAVALVGIAACGDGDRDFRLPPADSAAAAYGEAVEAEASGNLLEVRIEMAEDMVRGGRIWARSGPYFYLFSPPTRDLFRAYPDLAAVRVVTLTPRGEEIARAELRRDALSDPRWTEALGRSAIAQRDGTERPRALEELTFFGEDHTEYRYNPEFAGQ
jgi:predicted small lipoprotein YifL